MLNSMLKLAFIACVICSVEATKACAGSAEYTLTFKAEWTSTSHKGFPPNPHFSPLVGCSHNASYVMWTPGGKASTGVKNVAELGSTSKLNSEMQQQIALKNAHIRYEGNGISGGTGTTSIRNIEVNTDYPLVSFISMIAPSPDWFVGVHDYNLCDTTSGKWLDSRSRDLPLYDSGTDSGPNFRSANSPTIPPDVIELITHNTEGSLKGDKPLKRFGTFTFVKTFDSNPVVQPSATFSKNMDQTPTATITVMTNDPATPTMTTAGAANLVKQPGFVHLLLALILVNLCL